jgi:hypothetical protein
MKHAWEEEDYIKNMVRKPEEKRQLGRPRRRWGIILIWILER